MTSKATASSRVEEAAEPTGGRKISADVFQSETRGVTRTLGRAHNLDVVFAGTQAGTNGSTIIIPALPAGGELTPMQAKALRGFADHEAAHVRHSDWGVWKAAFGAGEDRVPPVLLAFTNAIEDVRIERKAIDEYPGVQSNLAATVALMDKHVRKELATLPPAELAETLNNPAKIGVMAITMAGRSEHGTAAPICDAFMATLSPDVQAKVAGWMPKVHAVTSTKESLLLAVDILKDLGMYEEPKGGPKREDGGSGRSGGNPGDGEGTGGGGGTDDESRMTGGGRGGTGEAEIGGIAAGKFLDYEPLSAELNKVITENAKLMGAAKDGTYRVLSTANDRLHTRHDVKGMYKLNDGSSVTYGHSYLANERGVANYEKSTTLTRSSVSVMRRKLERMVLSKNTRDWVGGYEMGALDPRRLASVLTGNVNVFRKRTDRVEMDTSVHVLIDLSGSMSGSPAAMAQMVAIAMAQAFEVIGVDYAIWGFNNKSGGCLDGRGTGLVKGARVTGVGVESESRSSTNRTYGGGRGGPTGMGGWGRTEALDLYVFKAADEKLRDARSSMGAITNCVGGNNSDGDAVAYAWNALRKRPGKRKILLVLSDGMPAAYSSCGPIEGSAPQEWRLRKAVQDVTKEGGECVGIGIMSDAVSKFYPRYVVARSLEDFASSAMDTLAKVLLGNRVAVGKTADKFVDKTGAKKAA